MGNLSKNLFKKTTTKKNGNLVEICLNAKIIEFLANILDKPLSFKPKPLSWNKIFLYKSAFLGDKNPSKKGNAYLGNPLLGTFLWPN